MKATLRMFVAAALGLATLGSPYAVAASTPQEGTGAFIEISGGLTAPPREAGGNVILETEGTTLLTGTVEGTLVAHVTTVLHPNGTATFHGVEYFTGTLEGQAGALVWHTTGTVVGATSRGQLVVIGGTGELADLQAQGTFEGTAGVGGTYLIQYHFEP